MLHVGAFPARKRVHVQELFLTAVAAEAFRPVVVVVLHVFTRVHFFLIGGDR